jgi:RHS repeat-associated protein
MAHVSPNGTLENFSYNYDQNGNRTRVERIGSIPLPAPMSGTSFSNEYEMLSYNGNTLTYDENGNLTSKTDVNSVVTTYTWDARNRLISISSPTLTASFQYDALNRRIGKTVNGVTVSYLYDGVDIIQETSGGVKTNYIRTFNIDEPLTRVTGTDVKHYLKDGLGSVVGIVDDSGNLVSSISYDPYGNTTSTEPFGYTGRENDGTGLMYYRARYYSPEMLRFISRDPLQFAAGSVNFYSYVHNNPIKHTDPSGLATCFYSVSNGQMTCTPDNPENASFWGKFASGNNSIPGCKNNPACADIKGVGPIPLGDWVWTEEYTKKKNGRVLSPLPGTNKEGRTLIRSHSCKNPFGPSKSPKYCSEGCVTGSEEDLIKLNKLLDAEPGSILHVVF